MLVISKPIGMIGILLLLISHNQQIYFVFLSIILRAIGFTSSGLNFQIIVSESNNNEKNGLGKIYSMMIFLYFVSTIAGALYVNQTGFEFEIYFGIFLGSVFINWLCDLLFITDVGKYTAIVQQEKNKSSNQVMESEKTRKNLKSLLSTPRVKAAIVVLTLDVFFWALSLSILNASMQDRYGITLKELAYFQIWFNISNMIFQIPGGHLTDVLGKKKTLIISEATGLIIFSLHIMNALLWDFGYNFVTPILIAINICFGITVSTFASTEMMIMTNLDKHKKGESYGIVSFIRGLGAIPTGILGGLLIQSLGFISPFIITLIGIIIILWYLHKYGHYFEDSVKKTSKMIEDICVLSCK